MPIVNKSFEQRFLCSEAVASDTWGKYNWWRVMSSLARGISLANLFAWRLGVAGYSWKDAKKFTLFFSCLLTSINNLHNGIVNCLELSIGVWGNQLLLSLRSARMCSSWFKSIRAWGKTEKHCGWRTSDSDAITTQPFYYVEFLSRIPWGWSLVNGIEFNGRRARFQIKVDVK